MISHLTWYSWLKRAHGLVCCLTVVALDVQVAGTCTCFPTLGLLSTLPRVRHTFRVPQPTLNPAFPKSVFRDALFPHLNLNIIATVIMPLDLGFYHPLIG